MQITMLETRRGTEDGFKIRQYVKGETYEVSGILGGHFTLRGFAKLTNPKAERQQPKFEDANDGIVRKETGRDTDPFKDIQPIGGQP